MSVTDRFRSLVARLRGAPPTAPDKGDDPAHAAGHRHLGPPPEEQAPHSATGKGAHDQPWVRTSHSDSRQRRFRR